MKIKRSQVRYPLARPWQTLEKGCPSYLVKKLKGLSHFQNEVHRYILLQSMSQKTYFLYFLHNVVLYIERERQIDRKYNWHCIKKVLHPSSTILIMVSHPWHEIKCHICPIHCYILHTFRAVELEMLGQQKGL
jgi:hypothetical protein